MGIHALLILAIISTATAAPWRCYRTIDGSTICFGDAGQPTVNPPSICVNRPAPPCSGPATVFTPCSCPPPCPSPCPSPCPQPCEPCEPCNPCPCNPCNPCPCNPCNPCDPCDPCLYQ